MTEYGYIFGAITFAVGYAFSYFIHKPKRDAFGRFSKKGE